MLNPQTLMQEGGYCVVIILEMAAAALIVTGALWAICAIREHIRWN